MATLPDGGRPQGDRGDEGVVSDALMRIRKQREANREASAERYASQSRERLRRNMETKIRTTMIGALSAVEQRFGSLWGQGKPRHLLTEDELRWDEIKEVLRTEILNNGNNQLRAAAAEIGQYEVSWNRYQYDLPVEKEGS